MALIKKEEKIEIPEGITVKVDNRTITVTGKKGTVSKLFKEPLVDFRVEGNSIIITKRDISKNEKRYSNTIKAHIKNMFVGVSQGYVYKLKVCYSHFPINVSVAGTDFIVKNFLGEKKPRVLKLTPDVSVKINGQEIVVEGIDKELTGQTAANIERLTFVKGRDRRIFQDGIYITEKAGKSVL